MLTGVLDEGITQKLVRLGSRSSDERISEYTLDKLERVAGKNNLGRSIGRQYGVMKKLEEEMSDVMRSIQEPSLSPNEIENHLQIHYPEHAESLQTPPFWIQELMQLYWKDTEENGEWQEVGKEGKAKEQQIVVRSAYTFWKDSIDLQYITPQALKPGEPPQVRPEIQELFSDLGFGTMVPPIPTTSRSSNILLDNAAIWSMSIYERTLLAIEWEKTIRSLAYETNLEEYEKLRSQYREACKEYNDIRDEVSDLFAVDDSN